MCDHCVFRSAEVGLKPVVDFGSDETVGRHGHASGIIYVGPRRRVEVLLQARGFPGFRRKVGAAVGRAVDRVMDFRRAPDLAQDLVLDRVERNFRPARAHLHLFPRTRQVAILDRLDRIAPHDVPDRDRIIKIGPSREVGVRLGGKVSLGKTGDVGVQRRAVGL